MPAGRASSSKGLWALLCCLILQVLFASQISALPSGTALDAAELDVHSLSKRYVNTPIGPDNSKDGPAASDYPTDDELRADFNSKNPQGPAVFFTQLDNSNIAYNFGLRVNGYILRNAFSKRNGQPITGMGTRSGKWWQNYLDRISGVFAEKASGEVYLVSVYNLADEGVRDGTSHFSRMELDTLKRRGGPVTKITLVNKDDFTQTRVFWTRPARDKRETEVIEKRDAPLQVCNDWGTYGDDANDPGAKDPGPVYQPGWCGIHFRQYQKNEGPGSDKTKYRFDVTIRDTHGKTIGYKYLMLDGGGVTSALPWLFVVKPGAVDSDPVGFGYADQNWDTGKNNGVHACKVGAYDNGVRQGDCGFTCN